MSNLKKLRNMSARRVFRDQEEGADFGEDDSRPISPDKQVRAATSRASGPEQNSCT